MNCSCDRKLLKTEPSDKMSMVQVLVTCNKQFGLALHEQRTLLIVSAAILRVKVFIDATGTFGDHIDGDPLEQRLARSYEWSPSLPQRARLALKEIGIHSWAVDAPSLERAG